MNLEACLPAHLRTAGTTITRCAAGLSGAGVHRIEADGHAYVLKIASADVPLDEWRGRLATQQHAADAALAPRIVHTDETRRATLSEFVVDRSFAMLYMNPPTRDAAIELLGRTIRRVHDLPIPPGAVSRDMRDFLSELRSARSGFAVPAFVDEAVQQVLAEQPPQPGRQIVLSHNDVNPTNLVFDGERLLMLDWDTAGPNEPFYDLAAISVFLRMDDTTCLRFLSAYDGDEASALPPRFAYDRRMAGVLAGNAFLYLARRGGHSGATGGETLDAAPTLGEFYQRMRTGELSIATPEGQWQFGLALIKAGVMMGHG